jgi:hypothetical protein
MRKSYAAHDAQRLFRQFHVFASGTHYALSSRDSKENLEWAPALTNAIRFPNLTKRSGDKHSDHDWLIVS